jgi:hypothetical protein
LDETKGHLTPNDEVVFGKLVKNWTQYFASQEVCIHPYKLATRVYGG